jgi:hypothetical protein
MLCERAISPAASERARRIRPGIAVERFAVLRFRWFLANARLQSDVVTVYTRVSLANSLRIRVLPSRPKR